MKINQKLKQLFNERFFRVLFILVLIGGFLRFYNLEWDEGYYFHPDERNIAYAIGKLDFDNQDYNPDFFAYGALPIYIMALLSGLDSPIPTLTGRAMSAAVSTAIIPLVYLLCLKIFPEFMQKSRVKPAALIAAVMTAFTPGLIQFAHFSTFEIFLTMLYLLATYFAINLAEKGEFKHYLLVALFLGMANATKVVSLSMLPLLPLGHLLFLLKTHYQRKRHIFLVTRKFILSWKFWVSIVFLGAISIALSPFNILDYESFQGSLNYESGVARGTLLVFYTQQFLETIPVLYQYLRVFPYILGWPLTILATLGFFIFTYINLARLWRFILQKNAKLQINNVFIPAAAFLYAVFHFTLFVKWTRYMVPLLPFMVIIAVGLVFGLIKAKKQQYIVAGILTVLICIQGINYFTIYLQPDPRIAAARWAGENLPANSVILSELYDLGIVPWNESFPVNNITIYNFYDIDSPGSVQSVAEVQSLLASADYIVLPSNRIYPVRFRLPQRFPIAYEFYEQLFSGDLGFELVAKFDRKTYLARLAENYVADNYTSRSPLQPDESFHVFDSPTILVFKKVR